MAMTFGKGNRSIAFNPTTAFPLDARSYFESYAAAEAAAKLAQEAGSTESVYYYGETLVVVENSKASFYIIQPDNTLSPVAGESITINEGQFTFDEDGKLVLAGFADAASGTVLTKDAEGNLVWSKVDAYTKAETDKKISDAVAAVDHLKRKVVASLEEAETYVNTHDDADQYIYMVPASSDEVGANDKYDEYMVITFESVKVLEKVGSWAVDLSGYATDDELKEVSDAVDKVAEDLANEVTRAKGAEQANATAAANAQAKADEAATNAASALNKVGSLETVVAGKVDKVYTQTPVIDANSGKTLTEDEFNAGTYYVKQGDTYVKASTYDESATYYKQAVDETSGELIYQDVAHTLLTPEEKAKLNALVIGESGGVEISGTVNIQNVQGLSGYLTEEHFSAEVNNKLNYITTVDPNSFQVTGGKLIFAPTEGRLLTTADEAQLHYIEAVQPNVFTVTPTVVGQDADGANILKNTLQLIEVPAAALTPALGDLSTLPLITFDDGTSSNTVVDHITNIYEKLSWGEL